MIRSIISVILMLEHLLMLPILILIFNGKGGINL